MESTAKLTAFVVFILVGARGFSLTFYGVDGHKWVEHLLSDLPGGAIGFLIFGYRVKRLRLGVFDREGRGCCTPGAAWSPFAFPQLAVGLAALMPLLLGSVVLVTAAGLLGVGAPVDVGHGSIIEGVWQQSLRLLHSLDWSRWQTYAFLYLALSIGAELSPSSTDLRYALPTVLILALGVWLFFFSLDHAQNLHHYRDSLEAGLNKGPGHLVAQMRRVLRPNAPGPCAKHHRSRPEHSEPS